MTAQGLNSELDCYHHRKAGRYALSILLKSHEVARFVESLDSNCRLSTAETVSDAFVTALDELKRELSKMCQLGLGHLNLARRIASLSNGERQTTTSQRHLN